MQRWIAKPFREIGTLVRANRRGRGSYLQELIDIENATSSSPKLPSEAAKEKFSSEKLRLLRSKLSEGIDSGKREDAASEKTSEKEEVVEDDQVELVERKRKRESKGTFRKSIFYSMFVATGKLNEYLCPFSSVRGKSGTHRHSEIIHAARTDKFQDHLEVWHEDIIAFMTLQKQAVPAISNEQLVHLVLKKFHRTEGTILPFVKEMDIFSSELESSISLVLWIATKNISLRAIDNLYFQRYHSSFGCKAPPSRHKVILSFSIECNIAYQWFRSRP